MSRLLLTLLGSMGDNMGHTLNRISQRARRLIHQLLHAEGCSWHTHSPACLTFPMWALSTVPWPEEALSSVMADNCHEL